MAQTEKPTGKNEMKKQTSAVETSKKKKQELPKTGIQKPDSKKVNIKEKQNTEKTASDVSQIKDSGKQTTEKSSESAEKKPEETKEEKKKPIQKKPVVKKTETEVNGFALPISTKDAIAVCRFIKHKNIDRAIADIAAVIKFQKSVPMRGEIPHRKGSPSIKYGSGSGRFPIKAAENFEKLLKSLKANAENFEIENPVITLAVANFASRPFGRFGRVKRKRTHVKIVAKEKKFKENKKPDSKKVKEKK
ncbi:hypothetical protein K9L16_02915 [Candidatus Pacearchaeota archaeon]|nr:hypothetical protein [Candidatus Pacearchaeota archaeon]